MTFSLSFAVSDWFFLPQRQIAGGDASEQAMFNFVVQRQSVELMRYNHAIEFEVPFNSKNKFSVAVASWTEV